MKKIIVPFILAALFFMPGCGDSGKTPRTGQAEKDLGRVAGNLGGSPGQAQALLDLMREQPGKARYQISWIEPGQVIRFFGCDFNNDSIARMLERPNGSGTAERWQRFIMERLQNAAKGGTLNDTAQGKKPGEFQSF